MLPLSLTLPRPCGRGSLVDPLCGSTPQSGRGDFGGAESYSAGAVRRRASLFAALTTARKEAVTMSLCRPTPKAITPPAVRIST